MAAAKTTARCEETAYSLAMASSNSPSISLKMLAAGGARRGLERGRQEPQRTPKCPELTELRPASGICDVAASGGSEPQNRNLCGGLPLLGFAPSVDGCTRENCELEQGGVCANASSFPCTRSG